MNLLDLAATAAPVGIQTDGLPFGVTLIAPPHQDGPLLHLALRLQQALGGRLGATDHALPAAETLNLLANAQVQIAVVGAHLSSLPLNPQLTDRNARMVSTTTTAPKYRLRPVRRQAPRTSQRARGRRRHRLRSLGNAC